MRLALVFIGAFVCANTSALAEEPSTVVRTNERRLVAAPSLTEPGLVIDLSNAAFVVDASAPSLGGAVPVGPGDLTGDCVIAADRSTGFTTDFNSRIWLIDLTSTPPRLASGTNPIPISNRGVDAALSPDGRFLVVCDAEAESPISVVDVVARSEVSTFELSGMCGSVDVCRDGSVLVTTDSAVKRLLLDAGGHLTATADNLPVSEPNNVYCSPDGESGIVVTYSESKIRSFRVSGLSPVAERSLSGSGGVAGAMRADGTRFVARTESGTIDAFDYDQETSSLGAAPAFTRSVASITPFYGIDQIAVTVEGSKLVVPEYQRLVMFDSSSGAGLPQLSISTLIAPVGICFGATRDQDGDGLSDDDESALGTDPNDPDTDDDGLLDGFESRYGFNPLAGGEQTLDPDNDGLDNLAEQAARTNPWNPDSDADGLTDGDEIHGTGSSPLDSDTDDDLRLDGADNCPLRPNFDQSDVVHPNGIGDACDDPDHDGVFDLVDNCPDTANPAQVDTDGDGGADECDPFPADALEVRPQGGPYAVTDRPSATTYLLVDRRDGHLLVGLTGVRTTLTASESAVFGELAQDGILLSGGGTSRALVEFVAGRVTLDVHDAVGEFVTLGGEDTEHSVIHFVPKHVEFLAPGQDRDGDGLTNGDEVERGTNPADSDSDGDGLIDGVEVHTYQTDPLNPDTDGGGVADGEEVGRGMNPLDPTDDDPLDLGLVMSDPDAGVVFDTDPQVVRGSVPSGAGYLADCVIALDGRLGYTTDFESRIWVVDLDSSPPALAPGTNPITTTNNPVDLALTADGRYLVGCSSTLSVIDVAGRVEVGTLTLGAACRAVEACLDGSVLVATELESDDGGYTAEVRRLEIDAAGHLSDTGEKLPLDSATNVYCSRDARSGIVLDSANGLVHSFRIPGLEPVTERFVGFFPMSGAWARDGARLFVRASFGRLFALPYDQGTATLGSAALLSSSVEWITSTPGVETLGLNHAGTKLYVTENEGLKVFDAATYAGLPNLSIPELHPWGICFRPHGDRDGDRLLDEDEQAFGADPDNPDTDGDGLRDGFEVRYGFDPARPGEQDADPDGDGLTNLAEQAARTDPTNPDTDGGGISDRIELERGTDPLDPSDDLPPEFGLELDRYTGRALVIRSNPPGVVGPVGPSTADGDCQISPDGHFGVATNYNSQLWFVDLTATPPRFADGPNPIPISCQGGDVVSSTDGRYMLVAGGSTRISVVDLASRTEISAFNTGIFIDAIDACPDGSVLVASAASGTIRRLTLDATGHLSNTGEQFSVGGSRNVYCAPDGSSGVVVGANLTSFRIPGLAPLDVRSLSHAGFSGAFSRDGTVLYTRSYDYVDAISYDPVSGEFGPSPLFSLSISGGVSEEGVEQFALDHQGGKLHIPFGSKIHVFDAASGTERPSVTTTQTSPAGICFRPHGDRDGDGLEDDDEATHGTDPNDADSDDDGLLDGFEVRYGFDPLVAGDQAHDPDGDGLNNLGEQSATTNPRDPDTDDDGLSDGQEVLVIGTNPHDPDTDDDGLLDGADNCPRHSNASQADTIHPNGIGDACDDPDADGLFDASDNCPSVSNPDQANPDGDALGTVCDPYPDNDLGVAPDAPGYFLMGQPLPVTYRLVDRRDGRLLAELGGVRATVTLSGSAAFGSTSSQGIPVGGGGSQRAVVEFVHGLVALEVIDPEPEIVSLGVEDSEHHGVRLFPDGVRRVEFVTADGDVDGDGLDNGDEAALGTSLDDADTDDDLLNDGDEVHTHGTDPLDSDTDDGGTSDGEEVYQGTNPLDPADDQGPEPGVVLDRAGLAAIFNTHGAAVVGTVPVLVSDLTGDCELTQDGRVGFVADPSYRVWVLDVDSRPPRLAPGTNPILMSSPGGDLASTGDGRFLVACGGSRTLSVLDVAGRRELGTFELEIPCVALEVCKDGSVLVAAGHYDEVLRLTIDGTGRITDTGDRLPAAFPVNVYCAPEAESGIAVSGYGSVSSFLIPGLTPVSERVLSASDGLSGVMAQDGTKFYVRSRGGAIDAFAYDPATAELGETPLFTTPASAGASEFGFEQIALDYEGGRLYVPEPSHLKIIDAETGATLPPVATPQAPSPTSICLRPRGDIDGDGLSDADESLHGTDPNNADSDGDGLLDGFEVRYGLDPLSSGEQGQDPDADGLDNLAEQSAGTDPTDADTDDDGLTDGFEVHGGTTDPHDPDTDDDGLSDGVEVNTYGTDPADRDTDNDGASDGNEVSQGTDPLDPTDNVPPEMGMVMDESNVATVFDPIGQHVTGTVPVGPAELIGDCAITPDGRLGFSTDFDDRLWVIDVASDPPRRAPGINPIPISAPGEEVATTPDGRHVIVCGGQSLISVVDVGTRAEIETFLLGSQCTGVDICRDGSVLVVSAGSDQLRRLTIDAAGHLSDTGESVQLDEPMNVYCAPDGRSGFVVSYTEHKLRSFHVPGLTFVSERTLSGSGISGAIAPDGAVVYARSKSAVEAFAFESATGILGEIPLFSLAAGTIHAYYGIEQIAVDHAGAKLYVTEANRLAVFDAHTGEPLAAFPRPGMSAPTGICFRPHGDRDADGANDDDEAFAGTDPDEPDSDGDGLLDGFEIRYRLDPLASGDQDEDPDGDGLLNSAEQLAQTSPTDPDTDDDGLTDGNEVSASGTDPRDADSDHDGSGDREELETYGTSALDPDSDGGGATDGNEVGRGSDPLDGADDPPPETGMAVGYAGGAIAIDPIAGYAVGSVPLAQSGSLDCVVSPDGRTGYSIDGDHRVWAGDLSTRPPQVPPGAEPMVISVPGVAMAASADGRFLVICDGGYPDDDEEGLSGFVSVVDVAAGGEISERYLGEHCHAVDVCRDGSVIIAATYDNVVERFVLDDAGQLSFANYVNFTEPSDVRCSPDGRSVVVMGYGTMSSFLLPGLTLASTRGIPGSGIGSGAMAPDGERFYVRSNNGVLSAFAFRQDTGKLGQAPLYSVEVPSSDWFERERVAVDSSGSKLLVPQPNWIKVFDAATGASRPGIAAAGLPAPKGICLRPRVDRDIDGLDDFDEQMRGTDADNPDSDGDGLSDGFEARYGLDPLAPGDESLDPDGDGLDNLAEQLAHSDPNDADTDDDGLSDGHEVHVTGTDPATPDSDGDQANDGSDNCPLLPNATQSDRESDGVGDACDNCADISNVDQANADGDAAGDGCDGCPHVPNVVAYDLVVNGDFERGNLFGWFNFGGWFINNGAGDPAGPSGPITPIDGAFDAITAQTSPGGRQILQILRPPAYIRRATLRWSDRILNHASAFVDPSQEFRVRIANGSTATQVFSTNPGDSLIQFGPNFRSFDITDAVRAFAGQPFYLEFTEQDTLTYFNVVLDNVSLVIETGFECNAPVAQAGADFSTECSGPSGAVVHLNSLGSTDPDSTASTADDIVSYEWFEDFGTAMQRGLGSDAAVDTTLPLGTHRITLRVTDRAGEFDTDDATVTISDTVAPTISLLPSASLRALRNAVVVIDVCDPSPRADVESVVRAGTGYAVRFNATDATGNSTAMAVTLELPFDPVSIRLDNRIATVVSWSPVPDARHFDVIRGSLDRLQAVGSILDLGAATCIASAVAGTSSAEFEDTETPPTGGAFFYLVQIANATGESGYDEPSAANPRVIGSGGPVCH